MGACLSFAPSLFFHQKISTAGDAHFASLFFWWLTLIKSKFRTDARSNLTFFADSFGRIFLISSVLVFEWIKHLVADKAESFRKLSRIAVALDKVATVLSLLCFRIISALDKVAN